VVIVTTDAGARHLASLPRAAHVDIVSLGVMDAIPAETLLAFLESRGYRLVLSEGGPSIFGQLLAARLVDEVFLTLAPQLAGRGPAVDRLSLVEGAALGSGAAWARLQSVLRSDDHLFVRYRFPSRSRKELS
jgi:riboflavin biosynthesis pyrimidine reductase